MYGMLDGLQRLTSDFFLVNTGMAMIYSITHVLYGMLDGLRGLTANLPFVNFSMAMSSTL